MKLCKERIQCVQNFYDLGTYKWVVPVNFYADRFIENTTAKCFYEKGNIYYGMPYSFHNKVKFEDFKESKSQLSENNVIGTDCIYAIFDALNITDKTLLSFHSLDLLCDNIFAKPLGDLVILSEMVHSFNAVRRFTVSDVYRAFSEVKPADVIVTYFNKKDVGFVGHVRLVTGFPVIVRDNTGQIDPLQSFIPLSECKSSFTDTMDSLNFKEDTLGISLNPALTDIQNLSGMEGKNTNFVFNKPYSFHTLYNQYAHEFRVFCIPMRFSIFREKEMVYEKVCQILREIKPKIDLDKDGSFMEENILDSLEFFSLIASLSETFQISLKFEDLGFKNFKSAETITDLVLVKRKDR